MCLHSVGLVFFTAFHSFRLSYRCADPQWVSPAHYHSNLRWAATTSSKVAKQSSLGFSQYLSEGALSPDGTVLATASHDGFIKFWQIYIEGQDEPR